jgi:hypothetical protein
MSRITSKVTFAMIIGFTAVTASGCSPVLSLFSF